jgi:DNA primase
MARIKEQDIDDLRERGDIVDIISAHTQLKRSGGHTFKGLCPFHSEKTPSFTVDSSRGLWFCFGCGEGGNVYTFVQKMETLSFPEAVEWVARKSGYDLHYEEVRPGEARAAGLKARLIEANRRAAEYFHRALINSADALEARRYLEGRSFDKDVAARWKLGYAPGRDSLCRHLLDGGFTPDEILKADLGRRSERDGSLYDSFRQRIIFPTWSLQGDVVGFGARALRSDQGPKYLNTAETPVFSKSRVMYGLDKAKSAISRGSALVVEGYTDVIALHEAGITEAVATNGVALTESHFELLKRFSDRAVLMFDADEAGKGATERGFGLHHRIGLEVLVAPLPDGRDPAEVVKEDGPEAIQKIIDTAQPLLEFKLEQTISKLPLDTPEARSRAAREAATVLGWHPDPIARHEYAFAVGRRIGVQPEAIQRVLAERGPAEAERDGGVADRDRDRRLPGHVKVEREALRLLLTRTRESRPWLEEVDEGHFTAPARRELFRVAATSEEGAAQVGAEVADDLTPEALALFTELTVGTPPEPEDALGDHLREVFLRLRVFRLEREIRSRRDVLQELNPLADGERHDALFTELVGLEAQRRDLLRSLDGTK